MQTRTKKRLASALRILLVVVAVVLQVAFILVLVNFLRSSALYLYIAIEIFAVIEIMTLVNRNKNNEYTIAWVIVIAVLPVFGQILYMLWGRSGNRGVRADNTRKAMLRSEQFMRDDPDIYDKLKQHYPQLSPTAKYLRNQTFPLYQGTQCQYYDVGEKLFEAMLADMEKAEKFIFLEYYIIQTGRLWDEVLDVLTRKAAEGVEVRLLFDDWGSIMRTPDDFIQMLQRRGITAVRYNPIHKFISKLYLNYRNHQKVTVVDGHVGYTGGVNIADEYANYIVKHGHWKDTGIRMEGDAVWGLTTTFLQMWDAETQTESDYPQYEPTQRCEDVGFFQPFSDSPVNNPENPAEAMYMKMILNAKEYIYITTPYLVIGHVMMTALCNAARSGVDVRIVTPKIWDHWYVHVVTRSNYGELIEAGVKIYEYTPGMIHAKTIMCDDEQAITGTINMDYRSFNLQFENGVWICDAPVLSDIKADLLATFDVSERIALGDWLNRPLRIRLMESFMRMFAVML